MKCLLFILSTFSLMVAHAELIQYGLSNTPISQTVKFSIPYTMGTHEGAAHQLQALVHLDKNDKVVTAHFRVPINSMTTGNKTRDCHMRESLGIDYTQSQFPKEHVCNSNDQIPEAGPDSIQYPDLTVDFVEMTLPTESITIGVPQISNVTVRIKIHGIEKTNTFPVTIVKTINENGVQGFKLISQFRLLLSDFDIKVKPFKIGFIKIGVKDTVSIQVAMELVRI